MEFGWRAAALLIGLIGIVVIIIDGFRRMKQSRAAALKIEVSDSRTDLLDEYNPELPSGGFRVIESSKSTKKEPVFSDAPVISQDSSDISKNETVQGNAAELDKSLNEKGSLDDESDPSELVDAEPSVNNEMTPTQQRAHEEYRRIADEQRHQEYVEESNIPLPDVVNNSIHHDSQKDHKVASGLSDVLDDNTDPYLDDGVVSKPRVVKARVVENSTTNDTDLATATQVATDLNHSESLDEDRLTSSAAVTNESDNDFPSNTTLDTAKSAATYDIKEGIPEAVMTPAQEDPDTIVDPHLEQEVEALPVAESDLPVNFAGPHAEILANRPDPELVLIINVIAKDPTGFDGKQLLFLFDSCDLRFGEKQIFHRFEQADGAGNIQFSVAQSHEPGTFVPSAISNQRFTGLTFFMGLPGARKPLEAYEAMYEMSQVISSNLGADVLDGSFSALTSQTREHDRQQILEFERKKQLLAKKAQQ